MNPFDSLALGESLLGALGDINGATGGAAGALLPPPFGTDTSIAPNAPGAGLLFKVGSGEATWNLLLQNIGVLIVGILIFVLGMGLLVFAWGEHIASSVESVASKIPVVPV